MKDYKFYKEEDFIEDEDFRSWVYFTTPEKESFWQEWINLNPEQQETITTARQWLLDIRGEQLPLPEKYVHTKVTQLLDAIEQRSEQDSKPVRQIGKTWWIAAASAIFLIGVSVWLYLYESGNRQQPILGTLFDAIHTFDRQEERVVINTEKRPKVIILSDSSRVTLYPDSRLVYRTLFDEKKREVKLSGEAFFEITKDPNKPFLVYANEVVTKVLGTSFHIKAHENDKLVIVSVHTGKVSVFQNTTTPINLPEGKTAALLLKPNQQATFFRKEARLIRTLIDKPMILDSLVLPPNFTFKHTPIAKVFSTLEKAYHVTIVYDKDKMATCTLTARLSDESLYQKLDWICAGTNSTYQIVDGQIVVQSQGCQ
ncbi:FecR family protein [Xanthocytophaga flava]|uniref:FecR family protein n=1 Tax=Xanthocytophaga flava TaxID=3048013 RepID=UPI0028D6B0BB|nr:FecR family protein [Xanthocytophaga flavus]MDJ1471690.1 FecR family protein [Xanthocytophaga flavus]